MKQLLCIFGFAFFIKNISFAHATSDWQTALKNHPYSSGLALVSAATAVSFAWFGNSQHVPILTGNNVLDQNINLGTPNIFSAIGTHSIAPIILSTPLILYLQQANNWGTRLTIFIESQLVTSALTQIAKYGIGRTRPDQSDSLSFFSGHSSAAFAWATFVSLEGKKYCTEYKWLCQTTPFALATAIALSRITAQKHYPTDVLAGAAVGTVITWWYYQQLNEEENNQAHHLKTNLIIGPEYVQLNASVVF